MIKFTTDFILRFKWIIIVFLGVLSVVSVVGFFNLKIEGDIINTLPKNDPFVSRFKDVGEEFKGNLVGMVIIKSNLDVFTRKTFEKLSELTEAYKGIEGVTEVTSLVSAMDIKKTDEGIEVGELVEPGHIPVTDREFRSLKLYVLKEKSFNGKLVSANAKYANIIIRFADNVDRGKVGREVIDITEKLKGNFKVFYGGFPMQIAIVNSMIIKDLYILIPIAVLILVIILLLSFSSFEGIYLPLIVVFLSVLYSVGFMGIVGVAFSIFSDIVPVILLAVGSAYGIHFLYKYYEDIKKEKYNVGAIRKSLKEVGISIILAALTTFIGFISLLFSQLDDIRKFGIFTGFGVVLAMLLSIVLIPIILSFKKNTKRIKVKKFDISNLMILFARVSLKRYRITLILALLVFVLLALGIPGLKRNVDLINYFPKTNPVRVSERLIREEFGGGNPLEIVVASEDIRNPVVLKVMEHIEEYLEKIQMLSRPYSLTDFIVKMNGLLIGHSSVPGSKVKIENLYVLLEGEPSMAMFINQESKKALIDAYMKTNSTDSMKMVARYVDSLLGDYDGDYVYVNPDSVISGKTVLLENYAARYARLIISVFNLKKSYSSKLARLLLDARLNNKYYTKIKKDKILEGIKRYLASDECEIYIKSSAKRNRIAEKIVYKRNVKSILLKELSLEMYENDTVFLHAFAKSLVNIIKELKRESFTEELSSVIKKRYSIEEQKRLKDIVYEFSSPEIFVRTKDIEHELSRKDLSTIIEKGEVVSVKLSQTGFHLLYMSLDNRLISSMIQSLCIALILVFIMMSIKFKGVKNGLIAIISVIFTIVAYLGIMGWFSIPLDIVTSLIGPLAIGMGIDYTIHIMSRLIKERGNKTLTEALRTTLISTGSAVVINVFSVGLGFLVLIFATLIPLKRFGIMTALAMVLAAVSSLMLLPALLMFINGRKTPLKRS